MSLEGPPRKKKTFYEILGVGADASDKEISESFRELSKKFHPDNQESGDEEKYKKISEAYTALKKPESRDKYDTQRGHSSASASPGATRPTYEARKPRVINLTIETNNGKAFITKEGKRISKEYDAIQKAKEGIADFYIGILPNQVDIFNPNGMFDIVEASYKSIEYKNGILVGKSLYGNSESLLSLKSGKEVIGGYTEFNLIDGHIVGTNMYGTGVDVIDSKTGLPISHNFKTIEIEDGKLVATSWDGKKGRVSVEKKK